MTYTRPRPPAAIDRLRKKGPGTRIAVVGASNNPGKFGNIIVRDLAAKGYTVLPVNPREPSIAGLVAARSLAEVERPVDLVVVVTPPPVTLGVLKEAAAQGFDAVWLQDGSFDDAVLEFARAAPFETVHHACVMVVSDRV